MGTYLNSVTPYSLYKNETLKPYFVDKTRLLEELFPLVETGTNYICITRPRRFGKTVMASMAAAFFGRGMDSEDIFHTLEVGKADGYQKHLNQHHVIYIPLNELPRKGKTYEDYIDRIESMLIKDLIRAYPGSGIDPEAAIWDILNELYETENHVQFIFILDEWDYIFHRDFVTGEDKKNYISFLRNLLKDKPYVSLAYMTGILPIAKYSSGSELNMFLEYSMASQSKFGGYFGFTESEVDMLYQRYLDIVLKAGISREDLRVWYDGYHTLLGERMYNPRSVVAALSNNQIGSYWTSSGPYDEIFYYIEKNVADVRDDLALMAAGEAVPVKVQEYAATSMNLNTKDEIFSAMVVYGFLSCEDGKVSIPNKELMDRFDDMLQKETSLGYVNRLAKESDRMLNIRCGDRI